MSSFLLWHVLTGVGGILITCQILVGTLNEPLAVNYFLQKLDFRCTEDLVTFTEGKLHFLCSDVWKSSAYTSVCPIKNLFREISQNLQQNTAAGVIAKIFQAIGEHFPKLLRTACAWFCLYFLLFYKITKNLVPKLFTPNLQYINNVITRCKFV